MSLSPVPAEQPSASCSHCGAVLVADQRYCLNCGQPASPVRLAFLDVLAPETAPAAPPAGWAVPATIEATPVGYTQAQESGASGWVRRNAGWMGLFTVLLLCLLGGLLIGHWVSQGSKVPATQTVKIEGLGGLAGLAGSSGASSGGGSTASSSASHSNPAPTIPASTPKQEKKEVEEAAKIEKEPLPQPKKATSTINKLSKSTGKKHHEEIEAQGATPIETG